MLLDDLTQLIAQNRPANWPNDMLAGDVAMVNKVLENQDLLKPKIFISPKYLTLLSQALSQSKTPVQQFNHFEDFLNSLNFELKSLGLQDVLNDLIREELDMMKGGKP